MTDEEHHARAMLLGLWYDHKDHTYNVVSDRNFIDNYFNSYCNMIDADTLEPVSTAESNERLKVWAGQFT